jgi:hypothetical protein
LDHPRRLYLIALEGRLKDGSEVSLGRVFPGFPDRVFAHWFTGELRVPQGGLLQYVHMGFGSRYERDLLIQFRHGVQTGQTLRRNGVAERPDRTGYQIAAFTEIGRRKQVQ